MSTLRRMPQVGSLVVLLLFIGAHVSGCSKGVATTSQQHGASESPVNGDMARLSWSAFECAAYAEMAGEQSTEQERLFQLGYENGKRFVEAVRRGAIVAKEIHEKVPIGFSGNVKGPTTDFALGRIYQEATREAFDSVVKRDTSGMPLTIDKWILDDEVKKLRAQAEYRSRNCSLLKEHALRATSACRCPIVAFP